MMLKGHTSGLKHQRNRLLILLSTITACVALAVYVGLVMGEEIVYTHFFYVPVILAGVWYYKKALYAALFLSIVHILVTYLSVQVLTIDNFARCAVLIAVAYVVGFVSEKRAKAQEATKLAHAELNYIFNTASSGMRVVDKDFNVLRVNDTFSTLSGISKDEMVGKKCYEVFLTRICHTPSCPLTRILGEEEPVKCEVEQERKDGVRIHCVVTATRFATPAGELTALLVEDFQDITELKLADAQIKRERIFSQNIVATIPDSLLVLDRDLRIKSANRAFYRLFQTKPEKVMGSKITDILGYEDGELSTELTKLFGTEDVLENFEVHYQSEKLGERILNIGVRGIIFAEEEELVVIQDITARKQAEEALRKAHDELERRVQERTAELGTANVLLRKEISVRKQAEEELTESEEFSSSLLNSSPNAIVVINPDTSIKYVNPAFQELTGFRSTELTGRKAPYPWWTEETLCGTAEDLKNAMSEGGRRVEELFKKKDGERFWVEISSTPITHDGELKYYLSNWVDITERKRAEAALGKSEEKHRSLVSNVKLGIFRSTLGPFGKFLEVNPAMEEITGYPREELLRMNVPDLYVRPEEREAVLEEIATGVGKETRELDFRKKDGSEIVVSDTKVAVRDDTGKVTYFDGIIEDVTERKRVEEEREQLLGELEAKNRELESFVYTVSHDLKAPLISLGGFSSALHKEFDDQLGEEGRHYLERIQANVSHMNTLIVDLLELSRIGRVVAPIEEIDVAALLRDVQEQMAVELEEVGVEFVVEEPLPGVRADRGRIRQVFANLIGNAVKFRSQERPLRIEVGCQKERGLYCFHVGDNGIGIAPQYHEQVFEPFRQLDAGIEGAGMGLALVRKIVQHHRGRIWVEGEEGEGATFYFTLPREGGW